MEDGDGAVHYGRFWGRAKAEQHQSWEVTDIEEWTVYT